MHPLSRRLLLLGISLSSAAPLPAQWVGSYRTFDGALTCAEGLLEVGRQGTAFCSQAQLTIGRLATSNDLVARVVLRTTVPAGNSPVNPESDLNWMFISGVGIDALWQRYSSPFYTDVPLTSITGPVDFRPIANHPARDLYSFTPTTLSMWGEWRVIGTTETYNAGRTRGLAVMALTETTVPEPSTWALTATGLLTLGGVAIRRKRLT
jgi:hypothetical protein